MVDAAAERHRPHVLPADIERVGIGILRGIAVGRTEQHEDAFARRQRDTAHFDLDIGHAPGHLDRRIETQQLLDRARDQRRVVLQPLPLVGRAMQRQQPVADQVGRGLVAGAEQQADIGAQFLGRQPVARLLGPHQLGGEVVLRLAAAQVAELPEIDARHLGVEVGLVDLLAGHRHRLEDAAVDVAAGQERRAVVLGDAQHVADHDHRQAMGKIAHDVHLALGGHAIELLLDDLPDTRPHVGDAAGGEGLGHQAAQAGVVGRIEHQHGLGEVGYHRLVHPVLAITAHDGAGEVLAEAPVAQREGHVVVAAEQPEALCRLEDGRCLAQPPIEGIGIGDEGRRQWVENQRFGR